MLSIANHGSNVDLPRLAVIVLALARLKVLSVCMAQSYDSESKVLDPDGPNSNSDNDEGLFRVVNSAIKVYSARGKPVLIGIR